MGIDVSELREFAADCKLAIPGLEKSFYASLYVGGEIVTARAKARASFSTRIPGTIKPRRRGPRVRVEAGGDDAPHAAALENHGRAGSFRHPLFGDTENWYDQPAHPFLTPAAEESELEVERAVLRAIDVASARFLT